MAPAQKIDAPLFSAEHLIFDYLPKRIGLFVIPLGLIVALGANTPTNRLVFILFVAFLSVVQVTNYLICWRAHKRLQAKFGDRYDKKLKGEIERVGLNGLINRFWTGTSPE